MHWVQPDRRRDRGSIDHIQVLVTKYLSRVVNNACLRRASHVASAKRMWRDQRFLPPRKYQGASAGFLRKFYVGLDLGLKNRQRFSNVPMQVEPLAAKEIPRTL